jgi:sugar lactone lactonase YvrE
MSHKVVCPNPSCQAVLTVPPGYAGRTARCKRCGGQVAVPAAGTEIPPPSTGKSSAAASAQPMRIGRFEVRGRLGAGAFGTVYRAYDPQLDRDVALKVPHPATLDSPTARQRFLREARAAARLRHPHIVPVFDAGADDGHDYFAAAFIDGQTLSASIAETSPDLRRAAALVRDLAEALAYAHAQGVVHRDVKPANVLIDSTGRPHLMDFGLAYWREETSKLTHAGAVLGTPAYMAPEQAAGQQGPPLPASDQYALGVLLYQLLTGQTPFSGPAQVQLYHAVHSEPPPPRRLRPELPQDLQTICLKALAKKPQDRYADCQALADDLRRWLDGEPIHARRLGLVESLTRWCRREPVLALSSFATALCLLIAAGVATANFQKYSQRARAEAEVRDRAVQGQERATVARLQAEEDERQANDRREEAQQKKAEALGALAKRVQAERDEEQARQKAEGAQKQLAEALQQLSSANKEQVEALGKRRELTGTVQKLRKDAATIPQSAFSLGIVPRTGVVLRNDGKYLAFADRSRIHVWSFAAGQAHVLTGHTDSVTALAFHPRSPHLASAARDQTVRVWELDIHQQMLSIADPQAYRMALAYSPDGRLLASSDGGRVGSPAAAVKLWDADTGKALATLPGHIGPIEALAFSHDGKRLASVSRDGTVRLWDVADHRQLAEFPAPASLPSALAFSPDGGVLLAQGEAITAWAVSQGKESAGHRLFSASLPTSGPRAAALMPDGSGFVIVDSSGVHLHDTARKLLSSLPVPTQNVTAVAITHKKDRLLTVTASGLVRVWDVAGLAEKP